MKQKMRVAFLEEWPSLRGHRVLPYLARQLDLTYITSKKGDIPDAEFKESFVFPPPTYINQRAWAFSRLADQLYSQGKIDCAVSYASIGFMIRKVPFINFLGGCYLEDFKILWRRTSFLKKFLLVRGFLHYSVPDFVACRRAKTIIVNSHALKMSVMENYHLREGKIDMVYNGVDSDFFSIYDQKRSLVGRNILYIGRLHLRKGIVDLVKAFSRRKDIVSKFVVVGDGPDFNEIKRISREDSRIIVKGQLTKREILNIMKDTCLFVFPSFHEGCPNALLEAMAGGHACICYDIPPVREVLDDSGILVKTGNPGQICDKIKDLLENKKQMISLVNRAHERSKFFSWERCGKEIKEIILQMGRYSREA